MDGCRADRAAGLSGALSGAGLSAAMSTTLMSKQGKSRVQDMTLIAVQAAADSLGVSRRTMYELAAPAGPIPCYRIGRTVRFQQDDIEAYKQSRRCEPVRATGPRYSLAVVRLKASSPTGESELEKFFRKAGLKVKTREEIEIARKCRK
jgi:excisionase family DNA binding protein